jgi:methionyl-tRNA formyltransferase
MSYVIATSRPWNAITAKRLTERTGQPFHLITCREDLTPERLREIAPRYIFFPHWSYLIPAEVHEHWECVIFHMTDLPYGRGGSPLQNLIARGHRETQLTALRCAAELDAGPVYLKRPLCLEGSASEIFLRAAGVIEAMIATIVRDKPKPQPQQGEPVVFRRRRPAESDLAQAPIHDLNSSSTSSGCSMRKAIRARFWICTDTGWNSPASSSSRIDSSGPSCCIGRTPNDAIDSCQPPHRPRPRSVRHRRDVRQPQPIAGAGVGDRRGRCR